MYSEKSKIAVSFVSLGVVLLFSSTLQAQFHTGGGGEGSGSTSGGGIGNGGPGTPTSDCPDPCYHGNIIGCKVLGGGSKGDDLDGRARAKIEGIAGTLSGLAAEYEIVNTSGWPILGRTDIASPTGGWITDPVVIDTGELVINQRDLTWPHNGTIVTADRLYRHQLANLGGVTTDFGRYFHTNLRLFVDEDGGQNPFFYIGNGQTIDFEYVGPSTYIGNVLWRDYTAEKTSGQYILTYKDGYKFYYESNVDPANLISTRNRFSQGEDYFYNAAGYLTKMTVAPGNDVNIERDVDYTITRVRDYAGRTVDYSYDSNTNLTHVQDACGSCSTVPTATYNYDSSNRITTIKDANDAVVRTFCYDGSNRVTISVDGGGGTYKFVYGSPDLEIDPEGSTTEYTYGGSGRPITKKFLMDAGSGDDVTYAFTYDAGGLLYEMTLPNGSTVQAGFDGSNNVLSKLVSYGGQTITTVNAAYASYSQRRLSIDPTGQTTDYRYGLLGQRTAEIRPGAMTRSYSYNSAGQKTTFTDVNSQQTSYEYNSAGHLTKQTADIGGLALATNFTVDSLGRQVTKQYPEGENEIYAYDKAGKVTESTSGEGVVTKYEYDANTRQTARKIMNGGSPLYTLQMQYNLVGLETKSIAPDSSETTYACDKNHRKTLETLPDGRKTEWVYDQMGRVITIKKGDGGGTSIVQQMVYDKMGNVVTNTDALGRNTIHVYDGFGRRTTTTDPTGDYSIMSYDDASRATAVKRYASGGTLLTHTTTTYDALGRVSVQRQKATPGGADGTSDQLTEMSYDGEDRLTQQVAWTGSGSSVTTSYGYDGAGRRTGMTDGDGLASAYAYDKDSRQTKVTDPRSNTTGYAYDKDGRQTKVTNSVGDYTSTVVDQRGLRTEEAQFASGATLLAKTKYDYDSVGRQTVLRKKSSPLGADSPTSDSIVRNYYDSGGKLTRTALPSGADTNYAYDQFGRQTLMILPDGSSTASEYTLAGTLTKQIKYEIVGASTRSFRTDHSIDSLNRVIATINQGPDGTFGNGDDLTSQYVYDGVGRQVTMTNEAGRYTVYSYDSLNRKTQSIEDSAGVARYTKFQFDRADRLEKLIAYTDGSSTGPETTTYAYNGRNLQTGITYEETGTVAQAYDAAGNMTLRTDEEGIAVAYKYDSVNRLTEREKNGATDNIEKYVYDGMGRLLTAKKGSSGSDDSISKSIYAYDSNSRVISENQSILGGTAKTVNYTYDKAGNRISLLPHGGGVTATYSYDSRDRCTQVNKDGSVLADYTWLGNAISKRETTCDYPGGTKPKFRTDFQRDGILRVSKLENKHLTLNQADSGYSDLGTWDYTYDSSSNELSMIQAGSMAYLAAETVHTYDTADRLITTINTDTQTWSAASAENSWYSYDDLGNRISHQYRGTSPIAYAHDKANRMTQLAGLSQNYDKAGNVTLAYSADRGTSYVYRYDHHNRLTGVYDSTNSTRKAAFTWDGLGRRVEFIDDKNSTTTRYYYDGVNELVEDNQSAARQRYYIHGVSYVDERLMMFRDSDSRPYYYTIDRMYNVRGIVDRAGAFVERYAYDGYGRPYIRESAGRGDMDDDADMDGTDSTRFSDVGGGTIWDPRADIDDDGDVDGSERPLFNAKRATWYPAAHPSVAQAFSDVGNPYMFQGVPHFTLDTVSSDTDGKLVLNHHRARFEDPSTGRWTTRDPFEYHEILGVPQILKQSFFGSVLQLQMWQFASDERLKNHDLRLLLLEQFHPESLYELTRSKPTRLYDPFGLAGCEAHGACHGAGSGTVCVGHNSQPTNIERSAAMGAAMSSCYSSLSCNCVPMCCTGTCARETSGHSGRWVRYPNSPACNNFAPDLWVMPYACDMNCKCLPF
jgi:YD repeat-containing protein